MGKSQSEDCGSVNGDTVAGSLFLWQEDYAPKSTFEKL